MISSTCLLLVLLPIIQDVQSSFIVVQSATIARTKANGLPWDFPLTPTNSAPDPYVQAWVYDKNDVSMDYGSTPVCWDTYEPRWNKPLVKVYPGQTVRLKVSDRDSRVDDVVGETSFTYTKRMSGTSVRLMFDQVRVIRLKFVNKADDRLIFQQLYPAVNRPRQKAAVILIAGLDVRRWGDNPATPRLFGWQSESSPTVKAYANHADVFTLGYPQNSAVENLALMREFHEAPCQLKRLGYEYITLVGHSAGGIIARHVVEEHPNICINRLVQISTPNTGANLAGASIMLKSIDCEQEPFLASLAPGYRQTLLRTRLSKRIPRRIELVLVTTAISKRSRGDGVITLESQATDDLICQGARVIHVYDSHMAPVENDMCLKDYCPRVFAK